MRRVIVIAAAGIGLAGCSSFSWDAANRAGPARVDATRRRCHDVAGARLQDALLGRRIGSRQRFLGHLHAEQVPAGDDPGAGHPRPLRPRLDDARSQSGCCGTSARGSAAEGCPKARAEAEAKTTRDRRGPRGIGIPGPCGDTGQPLIACTAPATLPDCAGVTTCLDWGERAPLLSSRLQRRKGTFE